METSYRSAGCSRASCSWGHYIRHREFHLYLEAEDSENLAADATFYMEPSAVLFDPGTALEED